MENRRDSRGYYAALDLSPDASEIEIEIAFKRGIRRFEQNQVRLFNIEYFTYQILQDAHIPFLGRKRKRGRKYTADLEAFIKEAYGVLGDPEQRLKYDPDSAMR
jgi:curved DNA-binding protein CbpA